MSNRPSLRARCLLTGTICLCTSAVAAVAQTATGPRADPAAGPRSAIDPAAEKILDRLEARGREIKEIETPLVFVKKDPVFESTEQYHGTLLFKEDQPNPRFLIQFDRCIQDGREIKKKEWHVFDGRWYIEAREKTTTIVKHEVLRPDEKREVFRLGQGPFPLPFGQRKDDILRHFAVKLVPPAPKDPPGTDHLECRPLPGTEMDKKYDKVHFWIDRKLGLPVKVQTIEKEEGKEITASFTAPKLNTGMAASRLNLPELKGYTETEDRLPAEDKQAGKETKRSP